jgi:cytochrome b561
MTAGNATLVASAAGERYDDTTIRYHWLTVALVTTLWALGELIDDFPRGLPRTSARSTHIVLGIVLAIVLVRRILWRRGAGRRLAAAGSGFAQRLATATHYTLYALLCAVVLGGFSNVLIRGDSIYGLFRVPSVAPGDKELRELVEYLHGTGANIVLILAGLHALVALGHHFVLKDGVLRRMLRERGAR